MTSNLLIAGKSIKLVPPYAAKETQNSENPTLIYKVKPGDTLSKIADSYETSVTELQQWNIESDLSILRPGYQIKIYKKH